MTTDRNILPDDWEEKTPQEEYDFWKQEYQAYCDILSDEALALAWNRFKGDFPFPECYTRFLLEIVSEIGRRPGCGILVPEEVTTFLVSKRLAGSL